MVDKCIQIIRMRQKIKRSLEMERVRVNEMNEWELAEEMLARAPAGEQGAVAYCVEIMTIVTLRLRRRDGHAARIDARNAVSHAFRGVGRVAAGISGRT